MSLAPQTGQPANATPEYTLGPGDKLRITVFNEESLSGEFEVSSSGTIALPLVGRVQAIGLTISEFQQKLMTALKAGYLRDPKVSVQITNYRPFYIIGEVNKSGEYPYRSGLNVMSAIATAGGYTHRGNARIVYIRRGADPNEHEYPATTMVPVLPGDVVRVPERFF